jgi:DNA-binding NarL/FixJ family response regulator
VWHRWLERLADIRADARLGQTAGARHRRQTALSHREVEVLRLVAAGQSNREISDTLVLSVSTVEQHLAERLSVQACLRCWRAT